MDWGSGITYFGTTALKDKEVTFGIKDHDRTNHIAFIGREEQSRIELLAAMALQDVKRGVGVVIIDADGTLTQLILERMELESRDRLVFLDPSDGEYPFSWNPVNEFRALPLAEGTTSLSKAIAAVYGIPISPLTDACAEQLLADTKSSLVTVYDLVTEEDVRKEKFDDNARVRFEALLTERSADRDIIAEHGKYVARDTLMRNLLGQVDSKFSFASLAAGGIVALDLSRVRMFPTRVTPLVRIVAYALHARARAASAPISLFMHNALRYLSEADMEHLFLGRALSLGLSDTAYGEEDQPLREKALTRCASIVSCAPHAVDVGLVEKLFYPYVAADELGKLEDGEFAIALAIDGVRSRPFFAHALPLSERQSGVSYQDLIAVSRDKYTAPRAKIDKLFKKNDDDTDDAPKQKDGGSFSDTFRSIFSKRAGTPGASAAAPPPPAPAAPPQEVPQKEVAKKLPPAQPEPQEIAEEDLKQMLYVDPVSV
jgi:hypothetical protein